MRQPLRPWLHTGHCGPERVARWGQLGEDGLRAAQVIPPKGYLADVHAAMRAAGALCVADEVQCGFGRAGSHFWAFDAQGVVPDIVTLGKSIGNGFPMGAVVRGRSVPHTLARNGCTSAMPRR